MTENIKIPDSTSDMSVKHLPFYLEIAEIYKGKEITPNIITELAPVQISDLNALFFGGEDGSFDVYTHESNRKILSEILISTSKYTPKPLVNEIEVDGVTYVLCLDFTEQPVSFHRDIPKIDLKKSPGEISGMMYIEKGMVYNEIDKTRRVINPRNKRAEKINSKITLSQFLDLHTFFLQNYNALEKFLSKNQLSHLRKTNGIGKNQLTT